MNENDSIIQESGLGNSIASLFKKKAVTLPKVYDPTVNAQSDIYGTVTDASGKVRSVGEGEFNSLMNSKENVGTLNVNQDSSSNNFGLSDFASGAKMFGDVASGVAGLGSIYLAKKNYDLQKEQSDYLKGRDAASDAKVAQMQANYNKTA